MRAIGRAVTLLAVISCNGGKAAIVVPLPGTSWVLDNQETRYLASLGSAQRYAVAGDTLRIYVAGGGELRFARAAP